VGFPGIAGLICVLLALYAFQALPVSYAAVALIVFGLGLLIAEVMLVSSGLLAVGGVIALTLGSLMLFESPEPTLQLSLTVVVPTIATITGILLVVFQRALTAQRQPVTTGPQGLLGEIGVTSTTLHPDGKVFVHGELWNATSSRPIRQGENVRVIQVRGMQLVVEPLGALSSTRRSS
jgi:membrane-bound serine protease (ClpP class)